MRETKFRAWLKKQKIMRSNVSLHGGKIWTGYAWIPLDNNIELMQYTGLKDKNGVEIFEGDIVKDEHKRLFVIEYKFGGFNIVPINCYNDEFSWNPLGDMQTAGWLNESAEIIGNIYANKELLENE